MESKCRYQCLRCRYEENVPGFMIEEFIEDDLFEADYGEEDCEFKMPILICPKCGAEFIYKNTDE